MARFVDHNDVDDYKKLCEDYATVIGVILSKVGPVDLSTEDFEMYEFARLRPFMNVSSDRDGMRAYLLAEDEWPTTEGEVPRVR